MVGRAVNLVVDKSPATPSAEARLRLQGVTVANAGGQVVVDGLDLDVHGGEIVCVAGVQGNGQSELADALLGTLPLAAGSITLDGRTVSGRPPKEIIDAGLGFVPEDRQHDGFVGSFTVAENLVLNSYDEAPYARGIRLDLGRIRANADERVGEFDIRTQTIDTPVSSLSGGNQQKVVLARELSRPLAAPGGQPADPRRGRRRHRVPARAARRGARPGHGRPDRLDRARRGRRPRRPGGRDVPRADRRRRAPGHLAGGPRPDDGRRARRRIALAPARPPEEQR